VVVAPRVSREYILTNKERAYFAGETGAARTRSYAGLIVDLHKYVESWEVFVGDTPLAAWGLRHAVVLPQSMTREYLFERTTETIFLADTENIVLVGLNTNYRGRAAFAPRVDIRSVWEEGRPEYQTFWDPKQRVLAVRRIDHTERTDEQDYPVWVAFSSDRPVEFVPEASYRHTTYTKDAARRAMGSAVPFVPGRLEFAFEGDPAFPAQATLSVAVGDTLEEAIELARHGIEDEFALYDAKMRRVSEVLEGVGVEMSDDDYRLALLWAAASVDSLIMNQLGRGIFAGLHWFPNYWGRDTFISLPGACLVRGAFDVAREILEAFGKLQLTDESSPHYGRIPNFAMPGEVYYNTADGTSWFVREAYEYVRYTGDVSFAKRVFPVVERALDGGLSRRTDEHGFLVHGQAETWMDAGGEDHPHSPRGNRAVEIQALWITALESGAALAGALGRKKKAAAWRDAAERARTAFPEFFAPPDRKGLVDHLDPDGTPDGRMRPNQVFAVTVPWTPILPPERERAIVEEVSAHCVLKHGVTSLDPEDPDFHPRHLDLERYHFDEAYHNGDVWVWLSGPVVSAFAHAGLVGAAWQQTAMLSQLFYDEGAAGTLPELRNGVPPETGENVAGAVSQAWSLAEFLRNFYQDYLGVRPDLLSGTLTVEPALPDPLSWVRAPVHLGTGTIETFYRVEPEAGRARFEFRTPADMKPLDVTFRLRVPPWGDERTDLVTAEAALIPGGSVSFLCEERPDGWSVTTETSSSSEPERGS
jgi:glycogen debranching enzyme